jgi:hypothetical protein
MCVRLNVCRIFDFVWNKYGHSTTNFPAWIGRGRSEVTAVPCFDSNRFEPYVVLRKHSALPTYDESFTGYGKNKIELIMRLRAIGYTFHVLPRVFLMHMPHAKSKAKLSWTVSKKEANDELMSETIAELGVKGQKKVKLCTVSLLARRKTDYWAETIKAADPVLTKEHRKSDRIYHQKLDAASKKNKMPPCLSAKECY